MLEFRLSTVIIPEAKCSMLDTYWLTEERIDGGYRPCTKKVIVFETFSTEWFCKEHAMTALDR